MQVTSGGHSAVRFEQWRRGLRAAGGVLLAATCLTFVPASAEAGGKTEGCYLVVSGKGAGAQQEAIKGAARFRSHPFCKELGVIPVLAKDSPVEQKVSWSYAQPFPSVVFYLIDPVEQGDPSGIRMSMTRVDPVDSRKSHKLSTPKKISDNTPGNYKPRWSADGQYIAYHQIGDDPKLVLHTVGSGKNAALELGGGGNAADDGLYGGDTVQIAQFAWHPKASRLYVKLKNNPGIKQVEIGPSGSLVSDWKGLPSADAFWWSPDGRRVAWRPYGESTGLRVRDLQSGLDMEVCGKSAYCRDIRFSPDSKQMVYWRTEKDGERFQIQVTRLPELPNQKAANRIVAAGAQQGGGGKKEASLAAAFSPDGGKLAFFETGNVKIIPTDQFWDGGTGPIEGGVVVNAKAESDKSDLVWLDSAQILVVSKQQNNFPISLVNADRKTTRSLSKAFELNYDLALSPDRKKLAFSAFDKQQSIMLANIETRPVPAGLIRKMGPASIHLNIAGKHRIVNWSEAAEVELSSRVKATIQGAEKKGGEGADVSVKLEVTGGGK